MKKQNYKREYLCTAVVFSYIDPIHLDPVDPAAPWYKEKKQVYSDNYKAIVLQDGYRVQYAYEVYKFHKVKLSDEKIKSMIAYLKANPKRSYRGWLHHANFYGGISKKFVRRVDIDFQL
jgi:hypothetical protein